MSASVLRRTAGWGRCGAWQLAGASAYWACGGLSRGFDYELWLPTGLALALCLRWGPAALPGLLAGALSFRGLLGLAHGADLLLQSSAELAGALLAAALLTRRSAPALLFRQLQPALRFAAIALFVAALLPALALLPAAWQAGQGPLPAGFAHGWIAIGAGILSLTPPLSMLLAGERPQPSQGWLWLAAPATAALGWVVLHAPSALSPSWLVLPLVAMVFVGGLLQAWLTALLLAGLTMRYGASGIDALQVAQQNIILLLFGALCGERWRHEAGLREANAKLEERVDARTRELAESENRLRLMADAAPFPLAVNLLQGGKLIYANARAEELFRNRLQPERPMRVQDFYVFPSERDRVAAMITTQGAVRDEEVLLRDASGRQFWALVSCSVIKSGRVWYVINGINDISERKRLEQELREANQALRHQVDEVESRQRDLREQALRDPLTGLFNRRHLDEVLPRILAHMLALHRDVAVLMVDADHFKAINDTHGHKSGDLVLTALGAFLSDCFRSGDIVCRYGGEEFFVLMPGASLEAAYAKGQQLCDGVRSLRVPVGERELRVTVSVGLAVCPLHGRDAESVVRAADAALYRAKRQGRDRVEVAAATREQPA